MGWRSGHTRNEAFPGRIGRKLGLAMGLALFLVLSVGGISIFLSNSISRGAKAIKADSDDIEHVNRLHITMHHAVEMVLTAVITGERPHLEDPDEDPQSMMGNLNRELAEYLVIKARENSPDQRAEVEILREVVGVTSNLADHMGRIINAMARHGKVNPETAKHLYKLTYDAHELFEKMSQIHHPKMIRSIQASEAKMKRIMQLYIAFAFLGCFLLIVGRVLFSRTIISPVQRLAFATIDIAAGDFGKRVAVMSKDEIGQLTHSFNVMAEKLQDREGELRTTQQELARKVRESEALYKVSMEISAHLELDSILASVADKAKELLGGDAACLCLLDAEGRAVPKATAGTMTDLAEYGICEAGRDVGSARGKCNGEFGQQHSMVEGAHNPAHIVAQLKRGEKSIGTLSVASSPSRRGFSAEEAGLLQGLAAQASVAIENARLHEKLQGLVRLEERERIAMDLHDDIIQSIYAVGLNLEGSSEMLHEDSSEVRPHLKRAVDDLNDVIGRMRDYVFNLRAISPGEKGPREALVDALKMLNPYPSITVELMVDEIGQRLSRGQVAQLQLITQEALANVVKHAQASRVTVRLEVNDRGLLLSVSDNGVGFDHQALTIGHGLGLRNMAERTKALGGTLTVKNASGGGSEVAVQIPLTGGDEGGRG